MRNKIQWIFRKIAKLSTIRFLHYVNKDITDFSFTIGHQYRMLDVGSARSPFKSYFSFDKYISADIDPDRGADVMADISSLPFRDNVADIVVCTEVLEHIPYTHKALEEMSRILKRKGYLVITVPFLFGVHENVDFFRWTESGIKFCLSDASFDCLEIRKNGGILSLIGETLAHAPHELFGPYSTTSRNWFKYCFVFCLYLLLIPTTKLLFVLDVLDTKRNFTSGYSVLCQKNE